MNHLEDIVVGLVLILAVGLMLFAALNKLSII